MKYDTFIFDFDYTLADATPGIAASMNFALQAVGFPAQDVEPIRRTVGMTLEHAFRELTGVDDDAIVKEFRKQFMVKADEVMARETTLFPDTVAVLRAIKNRGFKTAIVTSKMNYRIVHVLDDNGIRDLVDCIVGFEDVAEPKPSPEGVYTALATIGSDAAHTLYVGDSVIDAETAQRANVDFAAVTTGTTAAGAFAAYANVCVAGSLTAVLDAAEGM